MVMYGLYNKVDGTIAETPVLETFMWLVSETPAHEMCECGVYENNETGERIVHQTLDEWLFDFIGRPF